MYIGEAQNSSLDKNMSPKALLLNNSIIASIPSLGFTAIKALPQLSSSSIGVLLVIGSQGIVLAEGVVGNSSKFSEFSSSLT